MLAEEAHGALAVASRRRLLEILDGTDGMDVAALAAATGQHTTTVRFHLTVLARAGLVSERTEHRPTRGRPRTLYTATSPSAADAARQALTDVLVSHLARTGHGALAEEAGRAWARQLGPTSTQPAADMPSATRSVVAVFTDIGFAPRSVPQPGGTRIDLHACPFRTLAAQHPDVICAMHLGMLRQLLEEATAGTVEAVLTPFAEPELCVIDLTETAHRSTP